MEWWKNYTRGPVPYADKGRTMAGCDCWGLLRLVYRDVLGVELPSYLDDYNSADDKNSAAAAISRRIHEWTPVPMGSERSGDAVSILLLGLPCHVGVVTVPGRMLHVTKGADATVESYRSAFWSRRVEGVYRHA